MARSESQLPSEWIQSRHLGVAVLAVVSTLLAVAMLLLELKFQLIVIALVPAALVCFLILRNPYVGVYAYFLYTFLRPYDFLPALGPLRLNLIIELLVLVSWVVSLVQTKSSVKWSKFNWYYLGFLFVIGINVPLAANGPRALRIWQDLAIYFVMLVITTNIAASLPRIRKLLYMMLIVHFYFALRGIYNYNFGPSLYETGEKTSGMVGSSFLADENDFALAINVMIPIAFFVFEEARTRLARFAGGAFLLTYALGVVSSFSRGGWVGLTAVTIYCVAASKRRAKSAAAVLLMAISMLIFAPPAYWSEMETVTDPTESTADERIRSWEAAFWIFVDHPIIGVGAHNAGMYLPNYIQGTDNPGRMWGRAIHGAMPEVLAETGVVGTAMFLGMLFLVVKYLIEINRHPPLVRQRGLTRPVLARALIGSIVGFMVTSTFLSAEYYPQLWTMYMFSMMLYFDYRDHTVKAGSEEQESILIEAPET